MTVIQSGDDKHVAENVLHSLLLWVTSDACADMLALDAVVKAGWTSAVFARLCAVKMSPFLQKRTLSSNFILSIGLSGDLQSIMVGEKAMITKDDAMKNDNHHSGHEMTCRERLPGIVNLVKIMLVRGIGIEDVSAALITSVTKVLKHSNRLNIK